MNDLAIQFASTDRHTVLLSSHLLDDIERVAERVLVMIDGQLVVNSSIDELCGRISGWSLTFPSEPPSDLSVPGLIHSRRVGGSCLMTIADADHETQAAMNRLGAASMVPIDVPFDDAIMAYLSRSRCSESFLTAGEG